MDALATILFGLAATSLLLSIALAVAWRRFGRERHAAIWSIAYALSAANWTANLVKTWAGPMVLPTLLSVVFSITSFLLIAVGFRERAGLSRGLRRLVFAASFTMTVAGYCALRVPDAALARGIVVLFCSGMLAVSADALRGHPPGQARDERATGGAAFWMLAVFAGYALALAIVALCVQPELGGISLDFYRLMMLMGVPTGLFGVGLFAMFLLAADLAEALRRLASSDPLTGVLNRRGLEQAVTPLIAQARRSGRPLTLVIADVDRFKAFNDRFGHALGDTVLQRFSAHVSATVRTGDLFGRLGGEEFVIVLPDTGGGAALEVIARIRSGLPAAIPELAAKDAVTASFGVAMLEGSGDTLADLMQRADAALYTSKLDGRDRATVAAPGAGVTPLMPRKPQQPAGRIVGAAGAGRP